MSFSLFFYQFTLRDSSCAVGLGIPIDHGNGRNAVVSSVPQTEQASWVNGRAEYPVRWRIASEFEQHSAQVPLEVSARQWAAGAQIVEVNGWPLQMREPCFLLPDEGTQTHRFRSQISLTANTLVETAGFQACYTSSQMLSLMFPEMPPLFKLEDIAPLRDARPHEGDVLPFVAKGDSSLSGIVLLRDRREGNVFLADFFVLGVRGELKAGECVKSRFISTLGGTVSCIEGDLGEILSNV